MPQTYWFAPTGDLLIDQRHKLSLFAVWEAFKTERQRLAISGRQLYNLSLIHI